MPHAGAQREGQRAGIARLGQRGGDGTIVQVVDQRKKSHRCISRYGASYRAVPGLSRSATQGFEQAQVGPATATQAARSMPVFSAGVLAVRANFALLPPRSSSRLSAALLDSFQTSCPKALNIAETWMKIGSSDFLAGGVGEPCSTEQFPLQTFCPGRHICLQEVLLLKTEKNSRVEYPAGHRSPTQGQSQFEKEAVERGI